MTIASDIKRSDCRRPRVLAAFVALLLLAAAGCGETRAPVMSVTGTPYIDLPFSEGPPLEEYSYDEYDRLNGESPAYFSVWNLKQSPLEIRDITVTGKDAAEFKPVPHQGTKVMPRESVNFTVVFSPRDLGPKSALVTVASADPSDPEFSFKVSYNGSRGAVPVARAAGENARPALVRAGAGYGLAWDDVRNGRTSLYFARLDGQGRLPGEKTVVAATPASRGAASSLAWTGDGYGLAWEDFSAEKGRIYFARLDAAGKKVGPDKLVSGEGEKGSGDPCLVWNGNGFAAAWIVSHDTSRVVTSPRPPFFTFMDKTNRDLYFMRLNPEGDALGNATLVRKDTGSAPALAWTGRDYGIAWADTGAADDVIHFTRLGAGGETLGDAISLSRVDGAAREPALAWNGTEFGAAWVYQSFQKRGARNNLYVRFALVNGSGERMGEEIDVFNAFGPVGPQSRVGLAVHASGGEFEVSGFQAHRRQMVSTVLDRAGGKTGDDRFFPGYPGLNHSVVSTDRGFAVAWYSPEDIAGCIYFAAVEE